MLDASTSTRRRFLATGISATALVAAGRAVGAQPDSALAERAFIWGFPLVLTGRYRDLAVRQGAPFNRFTVTPTLATPSLKAPGPNVDTLYGYAWLDLGREPVVLQVPDTQDRYYSIQFVDAYANTFSYVGRRQTGTRAGTYVLTSPGWSGQLPQGAVAITSPTTLVLALTRTLVRGDSDLAAAQGIQAQYLLGPLSAYPHGLAAPVNQENALNILPALDLSNAGAAYFDELGSQLKAYPPSPADQPEVGQFTAAGIGAGLTPSHDHDHAPLLAQAARDGFARIRSAPVSTNVNGWRVDYKVTNFIKDPLLRAAVNQFGPGAHIAQEALYFSAAQGPGGQPLNGQTAYRLRFPAGQLPPVDAFWSLTLYGPDYFLVANPLARYAITDRTEGLRYGADGSLDILIQNKTPTAGSSNWLPAPPGSYKLLFRTYQPRPALYTGAYKLPALEPLPA
jgi:hypothetical protein